MTIITLYQLSGRKGVRYRTSLMEVYPTLPAAYGASVAMRTANRMPEWPFSEQEHMVRATE